MATRHTITTSEPERTRTRTSLDAVDHYSWRDVYEALSCPTTIEPRAEVGAL
jgi:hypothetical protein